LNGSRTRSVIALSPAEARSRLPKSQGEEYTLRLANEGKQRNSRVADHTASLRSQAVRSAKLRGKAATKNIGLIDALSLTEPHRKFPLYFLSGGAKLSAVSPTISYWKG
jgi:hypothetical protein